jgi:hypothetical protein
MGTKNFHPSGLGKSQGATNLSARAFAAGGYAGHAAGLGAVKDLAAAKAKAILKPGLKTAASNAPGPKKL